MPLDSATLHLSSALMNGTYGVLLFLTWLSQRRERHFLFWSIGSLLCAVSIGGLGAFDRTVLVSLCYVGIGFSLMSLFAGFRVYDGRTPFTPAMFAIGLAPGVVYALVTFAGIERPFAIAAGTLGLAVAVLRTGLYILSEGEDRRSQTRRAAGIAMLCFLPIYAASIVTTLVTFDVEIDGTVILLADQVVTNVLIVSILAMMSERARRVLSDLAIRDGLTGALNRTGLAKRARTPGPGRTSALIVADLDHFKAVNDRYGHAAGDAVLKGFVARAGTVFGRGDLVCRYGGEEFVFVVAGADRAEAMARAEGLRLAVARSPVEWNGMAIPVTVSVGVALVAGGEPVLSAMERADLALYAAKAAGRNRIAA